MTGKDVQNIYIVVLKLSLPGTSTRLGLAVKGHAFEVDSWPQYANFIRLGDSERAWISLFERPMENVWTAAAEYLLQSCPTRNFSSSIRVFLSFREPTHLLYADGAGPPENMQRARKAVF